MWTDAASIADTASPEALWRLFDEVAGWTRWNAETSTVAALGDVRPNAEVVDGTRVLVSHELQPLPTGGTRVRYAIRVDGPEAEMLGPLVSADLSEVLAALKALAGRDGAGAS